MTTQSDKILRLQHENRMNVRKILRLKRKMRELYAVHNALKGDESEYHKVLDEFAKQRSDLEARLVNKSIMDTHLIWKIMGKYVAGRIAQTRDYYKFDDDYLVWLYPMNDSEKRLFVGRGETLLDCVALAEKHYGKEYTL
jgi:hypothetical protein